MTAGLKSNHWDEQTMTGVYIENLKYVSRVFELEGITTLIEPISSRYVIPQYFMDNPEKGIYKSDLYIMKYYRIIISKYHTGIIPKF